MAKNQNLEVVDFNVLDTNVESRLRFKPNPDLFGGLCLGTISKKVTIEEHEVSPTNEDGTPSMWEFAGKKLYQLRIEFKQINPDEKDTSERFIEMIETIPSVTDKNGSAIPVKTWNDLTINLFTRLQHLVNVFKNANIAPFPKAVTLPKISFSDAPEIRIAAMKKVFEYYAECLNAETTEKKPRFEGVTLWMRVVSDPKTGSFYTLPSFVNRGVFEVYKANVKPVLELQPGDSLEIRKKDNSKSKATVDMNYKDADAKETTESAPSSTEDVLRKMGLK